MFMTTKTLRQRLLVTFVVLMGATSVVSSCTTTRFFERERVADRAMQLDPDSPMTYMLNKLAGAREGGFGGYGGAAAGGCGCE